MPKKKSSASNAPKAASQSAEGADETEALKQIASKPAPQSAATTQDAVNRQAQHDQALTGPPALIICRNK
jgi:hypothetical protein